MVLGKVESGSLSKGDSLILMPNKVMNMIYFPREFFVVVVVHVTVLYIFQLIFSR